MLSDTILMEEKEIKRFQEKFILTNFSKLFSRKEFQSPNL